MFLWDKPLILLTFRLIEGLLRFSIVSFIKPHEDKMATKLELLSEATYIMLINCIIMFTDLLNEGNTNDEG